MKLIDQVCTLEQAKRLNVLNVIQGASLFYYNTRTERIEYVIQREGGYFDAISCFSAFTVAELGEMLPSQSGIITWEVYYNDHLGAWHCSLHDLVKWEGGVNSIPPVVYESECDTMAEAMADVLIHCIENKLVDVATINKQS